MRRITVPVSTAAMLPAAMLPVGLLAAVGMATGSLLSAGIAVALGLIGASLGPLLGSALAARRGQRPVLLIFAVTHVVALVLLTAALERASPHNGDGDGDVLVLSLTAGFSLLAGLAVPPVHTFSRSRSWALHHRVPESGLPVRRLHRIDAGAQDTALVLGPALIALLSVGFGATAGLLGSAVIATIMAPIFAMDREAADLESTDLQAAQGRTVGTAAQAQAGRTPGKPLSLAFPGLAQCRQILSEARGLSPRRAGQPPQPTGPARPGWMPRLPGSLISATSLGMIFGGTWITLLGMARSMSEPALFALAAAGLAAGGVITVRWLPRRFSSLDAPRRRRLFTVLLALGAIGFWLTATLLPAAPAPLSLLAVLGVLIAACVGVIMGELHGAAADRAPTKRLTAAMSLVAAGMLIGLVLGTTLGGLIADEVGRGWGSITVLLGSLMAATVARLGSPSADSAV